MLCAMPAETDAPGMTNALRGHMQAHLFMKEGVPSFQLMFPLYIVTTGTHKRRLCAPGNKAGHCIVSSDLFTTI